MLLGGAYIARVSRMFICETATEHLEALLAEATP